MLFLVVFSRIHAMHSPTNIVFLCLTTVGIGVFNFFTFKELEVVWNV